MGRPVRDPEPDTKERFDRRYYARYYESPRTRVTSRREVARLGAFVFAYMAHLQLPVRRVLDAGCGLGYWRDALAEHHPRASYRGIEVSEYLCRTKGWERASIVDYAPRGQFDLVVCQGVLQYLPNRQAAQAIDNLAELCRGALYLEALTRGDWEQSCDRRATDGDVHLRSAAWYRKRLAPHFHACGGGIFVHRDAPTVLYELERG
ncbi:MAG: class I SAM-dependent methyltransferase [Myxococcales bacterium]|nr:class I SAM-dependent methyltransferase [Myxococcales bacterium]